MKDYKCLCAADTICITLVVQKLDFYISTPVTSEIGQRSDQSVSWYTHVSVAATMQIW